MAILKSNMDRFIEACYRNLFSVFHILKSNMDRFIDDIDLNKPTLSTVFKIQYG